MRVLQDITSEMAIHIPPSLIGQWILQEFSSRQLAFFRTSLLSLLAAHNYEYNIMQVNLNSYQALYDTILHFLRRI